VAGWVTSAGGGVASAGAVVVLADPPVVPLPDVPLPEGPLGVPLDFAPVPSGAAEEQAAMIIRTITRAMRRRLRMTTIYYSIGCKARKVAS
jgi:hypothetical protein